MLSIIVAASENNVIGKANEIPWYLPRDLRHFKELTSGNTVVMGRKTFDSIMARLGRPLPNRKNVILSRQTDMFLPEGCILASSWEGVMEKTAGDPEVFVCGGEAVYKEALVHANRLILTRVHATVDGETKFPEIDPAQWKKVSSEEWPKDEKNEYDATLEVYERNR